MRTRLVWIAVFGVLVTAPSRPAAGQLVSVFEPGAGYRLPSSGGGTREFELSWQAGLLSTHTHHALGATLLGAADLDLDRNGINARIALLPRYRRSFGRASADASLGPLVVFPTGRAAQVGVAMDLAMGWTSSLQLTTRFEFNRGVAWYGGVKLGSDHADEAVETEAVVLAVYTTVKVIEWLGQTFRRISI